MFVFSRPDWFDQAACRGADTNLFFPAPGETTRHAKQICATCPVTAECFAYSLTSPETRRYGVWGGYAERGRRKDRRPVPIEPRECPWCLVMFVPRSYAKCCSERCRKYLRRQTLREQRAATPEGHGSISRYHAGCRCAACAAVARNQRALYRARAAAAEVAYPSDDEAVA